MRPPYPLLAAVLPCLLTLSSCGSPPKPPTIDESTRRPANAPLAIELQGCKGDLHNARIAVTEATKLAENASASAIRLSLREAAARPAAPPGNTVFTVRFAYGASAFELSEPEARRLFAEAKGAPLIVLRGRTDGDHDTAAEARVARDRTEAVRVYLVRAGVEPGRIRATFQAVGDTVADNSSAAGRALNRRVEIEVYRAAPRTGVLEPSSAG